MHTVMFCFLCLRASVILRASHTSVRRSQRTLSQNVGEAVNTFGWTCVSSENRWVARKVLESVAFRKENSTRASVSLLEEAQTRYHHLSLVVFFHHNPGSSTHSQCGKSTLQRLSLDRNCQRTELTLSFSSHSKHILNAQVSIRAPCCQKFFDVSFSTSRPRHFTHWD